MRASILLVACLVATPTFAQGLHAGGFIHGGGHHGGRGHVLTPGQLLYGEGGAPYVAPEADRVADEPEALPLQFAPAPICPNVAPAAAAPARPAGPHIIYIGHKPEIHGPHVVYGTD
jgi:hypothetical protein